MLGGGQRKAIITPTIAVALMRITELLRDGDVGVAVTARSALMCFRELAYAVLHF